MRGIVKAMLLTSVMVSFAANAEVDKKTERTWKSKCASCHGVDGKAQTDTGKKLGVADYTSPAWQKSKTDPELKKAILEGVKMEKDGKKLEMDGYKDSLSPEQADQLVALIRNLK